MASTLELIYDRTQVFQLWSWNAPSGADSQHYTIRVKQRMRNRVLSAAMGLRGESPSRTVVVKIARGDEVAALDWEAELYENDLKRLQGFVVPKCYGYFKGRSGGQPLACLVLEFCNQPIPSGDLSHQTLLAAINIHKIGICHGDLASGSHVVLANNGIRIIDFARAQRHKCSSALVRSSSGAHSCDELGMLEDTYSITQTGDIYAHRVPKGI